MAAFGQQGFSAGFGSNRRQASLRLQGQMEPYGNQVRQAAGGYQAYAPQQKGGWTPTADKFNPQTGVWDRSQAPEGNPTPWNPATWRPPRTAGSLTREEWQEFYKANPVGSPGFNAVVNSPAAQRQRSIQQGQFGASPEVSEAIREYAEARGLQLTQPGSGTIGTGQATMKRLYDANLANLSSEDAIRQLREATAKINADNETLLAKHRAEVIVTDTMDAKTRQWHLNQESNKMRADYHNALLQKDRAEAERLRVQLESFDRENFIGGFRSMDPNSLTDADRETIIATALRDKRQSLAHQRDVTWGTALYGSPAGVTQKFN